ncbi:hypothetical protein GWI34_42040, partial [Actinomadura sp. DSM 109109]|nr:hypothetical protein [Actinomadura lepetitiana]
VIDGVFEGIAGVSGAFVSFVPNRAGRQPGKARTGVLNGVGVWLEPKKDSAGPFWTSRFEVIE